MKRVILTLLLMLSPLAVMAQVPNSVDAERSALVDSQSRLTMPSAPAEAVAASSAGVQVGGPVPPPPPNPRILRRRGSMVGYIDDAIIESKVRIRFDTGMNLETPDRAEFFYAKCGCYRDLPANNPVYDPEAPGPAPGAVADLNFDQLLLEGEYALTDRFSVHADIPLRWIQPQAFIGGGSGFSNQGGLGDLQMGVKYDLFPASSQVVGTLKLQTFLPTGDARKGLGTDHVSVQPAFLLYTYLSDRLTVESQIGEWFSIGGALGLPDTSSDKFSGNVFSYGIGPSYQVYERGTMRFAPVVELVGWHVQGGSQTTATASADASGTDIVNLKIGGRVAWGSEGSVYVGWGHALTSSHWYENIVRIEYRLGF